MTQKLLFKLYYQWYCLIKIINIVPNWMLLNSFLSIYFLIPKKSEVLI